MLVRAPEILTAPPPPSPLADGLWLGERAPEAGYSKSIVAGDLEWDPLKLMPTDPVAADKMRLKELKNGRYASAHTHMGCHPRTCDPTVLPPCGPRA